MKIVTWNLHGSARPDLDAVARTLRSIGPDLVGLQEVQPWQARRLATTLGWNHRWARKHLPYGPLVWWRAEGLALLSPGPIHDHERVVLNPGTPSWSYRRRIVQRAMLGGPDGGAVRCYNTHLASHDAPADRSAQAAVIARLIDGEDSGVRRTAVLTGDLNAADEPTTLEPFVHLGLRDSWPPAQGPGDTNPAGAVRQRLDYVLVGEDWTPTEAVVPTDGPGWARLSDHLPVVVTLAPGLASPPDY